MIGLVLHQFLTTKADDPSADNALLYPCRTIVFHCRYFEYIHKIIMTKNNEVRKNNVCDIQE